MTLFNQKYGIIPACDFSKMSDLENLVKSTCEIEGIVGYKIGAILGLKYGLQDVVETISSLTELPIIYDHQKFGTDIPDICGGEILEIFKHAGLDSIIIFPQAGPETLRTSILGSDNPKFKDTVKGCLNVGLTPIVGGEMTHNRYIVSDGGYIADKSPEQMYLDAAKLGVEYFVVPGTKIDKMKKYSSLLGKTLKNKTPKFMFPGLGKGYQGGDIIEAFNAVKPFSGYAIIGRSIYASDNIKESAERYSKIVLDLLD